MIKPKSKKTTVELAEKLLERAARSEDSPKIKDETSALITAANQALADAGALTSPLIR